jgi:hypothetical protein
MRPNLRRRHKMAAIVWCLTCRTTVWAYDHITIDLRSVCNMLQLPCPKCGDIGNFDGWEAKDPVRHVRKALPDKKDEVYDAWSALKAVAEIHEVSWDISPDCSWFRRSYHEEHTPFVEDISYLIRTYPYYRIEVV